MLTFTRPTDRQIQTLLDDQKTLPYSYSEVGALAQGVIPSGFVEDHNRQHLGAGEAAWEAAQKAVRAWAMFDVGWCSVQPRGAAIEPGSVVAILARNFGVWTCNPARILARIEEVEPLQRFGFVYGSLPDHAEAGEEQFVVEWNHDDDSVWYDLHGFSRPGQWFSKLSRPLTRGVQKRFADDSKAAMGRFVHEELRRVSGHEPELKNR